jgi:hypothetical protein
MQTFAERSDRLTGDTLNNYMFGDFQACLLKKDNVGASQHNTAKVLVHTQNLRQHRRRHVVRPARFDKRKIVQGAIDVNGPN